MKYIYGNFSNKQIKVNEEYMHKSIHKLLCYKDPTVSRIIFKTDEDFFNYFKNTLYRFGGLNELLGEPIEMVTLMSTLQAAYSHSCSEEFDYQIFRRLILDAHGYISNIFKEV